MSKYKEETYIHITDTSKGWTKGVSGAKYYRKDNWIIVNYCNLGIDYFIIDESYEYGYYGTRNKQDFLEEKHMFKLRKTPVWKALHGEYNDE